MGGTPDPQGRPLRCFIGLPLPESWQAGLSRVTLRLSAVLASRINWTRPGNGHLTLKFLGPVDLARIPAVAEALCAVRFAPFSLGLGRAGCFPPPGQRTEHTSPKALWAGLALGEPECARLAAEVERALLPLGFAPEKRGFAAHVTLGRVKAAEPGDHWAEVERAVAGEAWPVVEISRFVLWRSVLGASGPQYVSLAEFAARGL